MKGREYIMHVNANPKRMEGRRGRLGGKFGILAVCVALLLTVGVITLAVFTDRASHSMQFTTASFNADAYSLTRTAPVGPFCAGEQVTATLKESNTGSEDVNSVISMKATWVSPDAALSIFGNANAADNAKLAVGGTNVDYTVSADKKSITFNLPEHVLEAGAANKSRDLTLTIPESFKSTGSVSFTFEKVVVGQEGGGFSETYDRTTADPDIKALDYSAKVGWAASSLTAQNGKALMGYLTGKNAAGKYGIEFELAFGYTSSPMKDFASRTDARWSHYKGAVDTLTFVDGMTSIGDYAFPDFTGVKSVSFPATVRTIGVSAFDASGLTGTVTIPATVKEIRSLAFGNLPNVKTFTFGHGSGDTLTLPDNTAAGKRNTGAFYVSSHVDTTVNSSVEAIQYGYKWHDGYDNRRLVPTLNAKDTWFRTYTGEHNYEYTAKLDEEKLETITFADYHMPVAGETSWDASDPSVPGTVTAYLSADKTSLILAGNGYGLIFANEDSSGAFSSLTALKTVSNTDLLDTRNATTMADMFNFDQKLANISVSTWNVSKVENMSNMFYSCDSLPSIDLKKNTCTAKDGSGTYIAWNTSALKNTGGMFMDYGGPKHSLTTVDTTGWDTSKLEDASYMFMECRGLTTVKGIESWDVSSLKTANNMFQDCQGLQTINVANWKTTSLENTNVMFGSCEALKSIDISKWDMSKVTSSTAMFVYCKSFTELTLPKSLVVIGERFAGYCPKLTTITFNHPAGTDIQFGGDAFVVNDNGKSEKETGYVQYTPVAPLGTKVVTSNQKVLDYNWTSDHRGYKVEIKTVEGGTMTGTPLASYNGRKAVVAINGVTVKFTTTPDADYSYEGATIQYSQNGVTKTVTLDKNTKTWVMPVVDDKVAEADVVVTPKWKVSAIPMLAKQDSWQYNGTDTDGNPTTPIDYELLETIHIVNKYTPASGETSWDASAKETVGGTAYTGKVTVYLSADKKTLTIAGNGYGKIFANPDSEWAFTKAYDGMPALKKISGAEVLDTQLMVKAGGMFAQNRNLESVNVSNWNTGKLQNTSAASGYYGMFMNCAKLKALDVSGWNTGNVTETVRMFAGCSLLTTIDVSGWKTAKITNMNEMFSGAGISQIAVNGSGWDTSNLVYSYGMFEDCANLTEIDLSAWNVSKLEKAFSMFENSGLKSIDLSTWDESIVNSVYDMFRNCKALTSVNLNGWNLSHMENGTTDDRKGSADMFSGCTALTKLTIPASLTMFGQNFAANCTSLTTIEFLHDAGTALTFPAAGSDSGAFYVSENLPTTVLGTNAYALAYDWTKDQRKLVVPPVLAAGSTWYKSSQDKTTITKITLKDSYTPTTAADETWDASAAQDGSVMAYRTGTEVVIAGNGSGKVFANQNSRAAFKGFSAMTTFAGANVLDTSKVTDMTGLFETCTVLTSLDLSTWDTSKVNSMWGTFNNCKALAGVGDLSGWNTSNVTDMRIMFQNCTALTSVGDLSGWDTSKVTTTNSMFYNCGSLTNLNLSGWDTSSVTDMGFMFGFYNITSNLVSVGDLSGWNTSKVTNMKSVFQSCGKLTGVGDLSGWNTSSVTEISYMFTGCNVLGSVGDLSGWNTSKVTAMKAVFNGCKALTGLGDLAGWDTSNVTDMSYMFQNCNNLTSVGDLSRWNLSKVTSLERMFFNCFKLNDLGDLSGWDTSKVTSLYATFYDCRVLSNLNVSGWNTANVTDMRFTFNRCASLSILDLSGWDTSKVTNMQAKYYGCNKLKKLTLDAKYKFVGTNAMLPTPSSTYIPGADGNWYDTKDWTAYTPSTLTGLTRTETRTYIAFKPGASLTLAPQTNWYMGSTNKSAITKIQIVDSYTPTGTENESWDASAAQDGSVMAYRTGTEIIIAGNGSGKIYANGDSLKAFDGFSALTSFVGGDKLDSSRIVNMSSMFSNCNKLTELNLAGWETSKATNMNGLFSGCAALTSVEGLSEWNTSGVTNMSNMFNNCKNLTELNLGSWNNSGVTNMGNMFSGCTRLKKVTLGSEFKFIGTDGYLPDPGGMIGAADGKWYDTKDNAGYTPAELAKVTRAETRTYVVKQKEGSEPSVTLAANTTWYQGVAAKSTIKTIKIVDSYTPTGTEDESWDASAAQDGSVMAYRTGTEIIIAGNGSGKIYANSDSLKAFDGFSTMTSLKGEDVLDTVKASVMWGMFMNCSKLTKLDLSTWDTSSATDMGFMFNKCSALTDVGDLSGWDTAKVTNMRAMFQLCLSLLELNLSTWDTSNVTDMGYMFNDGGKTTITNKLTSVGDLSGWDTSRVTNMSYMFYGCGITSLDLSEWDTSKVTTMKSMFGSCRFLSSVGDLSGWNTAKVTDMSGMFALTGERINSMQTQNMDLSGWDTSNVTDMGRMFYCTGMFKQVNLSGWDTSNVTNMERMFIYAYRLTSVGDLSGWNTAKVTDMWAMFDGCNVLTGLGDLSGWDTSKVTTMSNMFHNCNKLTSVGDLSGWDTAKVTGMSRMFCGCGITSLDLSEWDTSNVTTMQEMFYLCEKVTSLDLSGWNTSNVTNMGGMFEGCNNLRVVTLGKDFAFVGTTLPTPSATYIAGADGKWYDTKDGAGYTPWALKGITRTEARTYSSVAPEAKPMLAAGDTWYKGSQDKATITKISIVDSYTPTGNEEESWDASKSQDGSVMAYRTGTEVVIAGDGSGRIFANQNSRLAFDGFSAMTTFAGANVLDTSKVTSMAGMFQNCSKLTSLDVSGWDTSSVTDMTSMFLGSAVTELDVSEWDTSKVTSASSMFNNCYVQKITMGPKFTLVGQLLSNTWYDNADGTCYTRAELEALVRTDVRTYTTTKPETAAQSMSIMSNGNEISGYSVSE